MEFKDSEGAQTLKIGHKDKLTELARSLYWAFSILYCFKRETDVCLYAGWCWVGLMTSALISKLHLMTTLNEQLKSGKNGKHGGHENCNLYVIACELQIVRL